jgi:predicted acyltransferase
MGSVQSSRLVSLDAFRGATMALMVLVNDAGDGRHTYGPLKHADWNGWTPTDVVFPSFLWAAGVAMTLSFAKRLETGTPRTTLFWQAVRRSLILYVLGLLVYVYPNFSFSTQRLMGVLQRIAICYLIGAAIYLTTGLRGQILWIAGLLVSYWLMMTLIPVPGYGAGRLDVAGNFAHYVDRILLGQHNYGQTKTWDPEGIVSTLPAIATLLFGIVAGRILRLEKSLSERTTWLFLLGNLLIAGGLILDCWMPINKKLWTSSFAVFMAGLDFSIFAMFVWLVDGRRHQRWVRPLTILGMNAIAVYMVSELLDEMLGGVRWTADGHQVSLHGWIYGHVFQPLASPYNASLLWAVAYTLLMVLVAYGLHRKKWYLKV